MQVTPSRVPANAASHSTVNTDAAGAAGAPPGGSGSKRGAGKRAASESTASLPRPAKRQATGITLACLGPMSTEPPSLQTLPNDLLENIGSFLPLGDKTVSRMVMANKDLRDALKQRSRADMITAYIEAAPSGAAAVPYLYRGIRSARLLPEPLWLQIVERLLRAIPRNMPADGQAIVDMSNVMRFLISRFKDNDSRYRLTLGFAAMLNDERLRPGGNHDSAPGIQHAHMNALHESFVADCEQFVGTSMAAPRVSPGMRAAIFGAVAGSMFAGGTPDDAARPLHELADRPDCGTGDTRLPLLTGLFAAEQRLPSSLARENVFRRLCNELDTLSPAKRTLLLARQLDLLDSVQDDAFRTRRYDQMHGAGCRLPQPYQSHVVPALIGSLHCLVEDDRQPRFDGFLSSLPWKPPARKPPIMLALASAIEDLPSPLKQEAAFDALLIEAAMLAPEPGANVGKHLITTIKSFHDEGSRQRSFEKAAEFIEACDPGMRPQLIDALHDVADIIQDREAHIGACRRALALAEAEPASVCAGLLTRMYARLPSENVNDSINTLLSAYRRTVEILPPTEQVPLLGHAAEACFLLEEATMEPQFRVVMERACDLPESCRSQALTEVANALSRVIAEYVDDEDGYIPPIAFTQLLFAAARVPVATRIPLLEKMGAELAYMPEEDLQGIKAAYIAQAMLEPEPHRHVLLALAHAS